MSMTPKQIINLLQKDVRTVGVKFQNGSTAGDYNENPTYGHKEYTYKTNFALEEGDIAIVKVGNSFRVVKVTRVDETPDLDPHSEKPYKWIVQKIDSAAYDEQVAAEKKAEKLLLELERVRQRELIVETMKKGVKPGSKLERQVEKVVRLITGGK